jgi:hypothetical protein
MASPTLPCPAKYKSYYTLRESLEHIHATRHHKRFIVLWCHVVNGANRQEKSTPFETQSLFVGLVPISIHLCDWIVRYLVSKSEKSNNRCRERTNCGSCHATLLFQGWLCFFALEPESRLPTGPPIHIPINTTHTYTPHTSC